MSDNNYVNSDIVYETKKFFRNGLALYHHIPLPEYQGEPDYYVFYLPQFTDFGIILEGIPIKVVAESVAAAFDKAEAEIAKMEEQSKKPKVELATPAQELILRSGD